jgi:hypothetical protein
MDETKPDLAIVSMHERGFPQADLHLGCGTMSASEFNALGRAPDSFFTMKQGDTLEQAADKARRDWPQALVVPALDETEDEDH